MSGRENTWSGCRPRGSKLARVLAVQEQVCELRAERLLCHGALKEELCGAQAERVMAIVSVNVDESRPQLKA